MHRILPLVPVFLLASCALGDGALLAELDAAGIQSLCDDLGTDEPTVVTCEQFEITRGQTPEECVASFPTWPAACGATVGDLRRCNEDQAGMSDEDVCAGLQPESCAFLTEPDCATVPVTTLTLP